MAKYLDYDGVKYYWQKILARFAKKGHTHTISGTSQTVATGLTGGAAPTLGTAFTVKQPTSKTVMTGAAVTNNVLTFSTGDSVNAGTDLSIPNVTSAGSMPTASTATVYVLGSGSNSTSADIDPS